MDPLTLRDRLREIVAPLAERAGRAGGAGIADVASGFSRTEPDLERALGGEWRDACFVVECRVDPGARYGRARVGDFAARVNAAAGGAPLLALGAPARPPLLFFDLETTGLSGGAGTYAFLVGCGWFDEAG